MAFLHIQMESQALHMPVPLDVILPQYDPAGENGTPVKGPYKTLYLLHGSGGSQSDWVFKSNLLRYVEGLPLAVVMPAGNNSCYVNTPAGQDYTDFLAWELPSICEDWFPLSRERKDRYIAGLSMGGYGAYHAAMTYPQQFAKASSISGALDISIVYHEDEFGKQAVNVLGPEENFAGGPNDLLALAERQKEKQADLPEMLSLCGEQDALWEDNLFFQEKMEQLGLPVQLESWEGEHNWEFWDAAICRVLEWLDVWEQNGKEQR